MVDRLTGVPMAVEATNVGGRDLAVGDTPSASSHVMADPKLELREADDHSPSSTQSAHDA